MIEIRKTKVSSVGETFSIIPWDLGLTAAVSRYVVSRSGNRILDYVDKYDVKMFGTPFKPTVIGKAMPLAIGVDILDMPIKFPGSNEYRIPKQAKKLVKTIKDIAELEHSYNDRIDDYYAYLTTELAYVQTGKTQRREGFHVDGYQGARTTKNNLINRSYTYTSSDTTQFSLKGVDISSIDDSRYNVFKYMDSKLEGEKSCLWWPEPYEIVFMNAYNIHRSPEVRFPHLRFFFRLSYDVRKFDRKGNTHNPMFDYKWKMVERNTPNSLMEVFQKHEKSHREGASWLKKTIDNSYASTPPPRYHSSCGRGSC